jgi:hypothetical protein
MVTMPSILGRKVSVKIATRRVPAVEAIGMLSRLRTLPERARARPAQAAHFEIDAETDSCPASSV